ncbi:hypothetical protein M758_UG143700 [Ceratodon purpureus]|nr:hypothetical protein M758_UG143700 [Ceratodon purpureus]
MDLSGFSTSYLDLSPTFSTSSETSNSVCNSADSNSPVSAVNTRSTVLLPKTTLRTMASQFSDMEGYFPARGLQEDDIGPGFHNDFQCTQPRDGMYEEREYESELGNELDPEEFPPTRPHSINETGGTYQARASTSRGHAILDETRTEPASNQDRENPRAIRRRSSVAACDRLPSSHQGSPVIHGNPQIWASQMNLRAMFPQETWRTSHEEQAKRRRVQREFTKPYLSEMASAHAEQRSSVIHLPTTTTDSPIGLRVHGIGKYGL